jgi:glycyl-tRNA synthetase alpha chain
VRLAEELQFSVYNFETADVEKTWKHLQLYEAECAALIEGAGTLRKDLELRERISSAEEKNALPRSKTGYEKFPVLPALDLCLKCSHLFNILDSRGAISVTERVAVIARIRNLAVGVAKAWLAQQASEKSEEIAAGAKAPISVGAERRG